MAHDSAAMKVLLFLTVSVHLSSADTHTLLLFYTGVTGVNLPEFTAVGLMDGEQFVYYDSTIREAIPRTEWARKLKADEPPFWDRVTERMWSQQQRFNVNVATAMQSFNQTKVIHTWQQMLGCELDDNGTTRGYTQYGCDGEDFIGLDLTAVSWRSAKPQATITENKWESTVNRAKYCKDFLRFGCVDLLRKFESYSRETVKNKVHPKVSILQKRSPSPEVVCHATGFFPKEVLITWQKDGKDVHEDVVELRETLPNQDGSFQKRIILTIKAEELQKHKFTCVVQHSSLEKELVLPVSRTLRDGGSDGGSERAPVFYIIGIVTALVALVAVVAVIVIWRKKSGFKSVPQTSGNSFEEDSSSTNS